MAAAKPKPRGFVRWLLRLPPILYRLGLAGRMGRRLLLLTTTGRRTGRPRTVGLNYVLDGRTVYVLSGFGRTDWYVNLLADPHVEVHCGSAGLASLGSSRTQTSDGERGRCSSLRRPVRVHPSWRAR